MKTCLFCSSSKLTKEHIYPEWLVNEFDLYNSSFRPSIIRTVMIDSPEHTEIIEVSDVSDNRRVNSNDFVAKVVCKICNNGWMSSLENASKQTIVRLSIGNNLQMINPEEALTVSNWCVLKSIILSCSVQIKSDWATGLLVQLKEGIIPEGFCVENARLKASLVDYRIGNNTRTLAEFVTKEEVNLLADDFFFVSLQIGYAGFRISYLRTHLPVFRMQAIEKPFVSYPYNSKMLFFKGKVRKEYVNKSESEFDKIETLDDLHNSLFLYG